MDRHLRPIADRDNRQVRTRTQPFNEKNLLATNIDRFAFKDV